MSNTNTTTTPTEKRISLDHMPYDMKFDTPNGEELCHATGYAVQFNGETTPIGLPLFWNEYEDSEGNLYYGN